MRNYLYVSFLLSLWVTPARADFKYEIDKSSLLKPSILDGLELGQRFSDFGFYALSNLPSRNTKVPVDYVYTTTRLEQSILVKSGLRVPRKYRNKIIYNKDLDISVAHIEMYGNPYLIMAVNITRSEFANILSPWIGKSTASIKWWFLSPQKAQASEFCEHIGGNNLADFKGMSAHVEDNEILKTIGQCGLDALDDIRQSAESTLDFFTKLASDPVSLWQEVKEGFQGLKDLTLGIKANMAEMFLVLGSLSLDVKKTLVCKVAGRVISSAFKGLGAATSIAGMLIGIQKVTKILGNLQELEKKGVVFPNKGNIASKVVSCAL